MDSKSKDNMLIHKFSVFLFIYLFFYFYFEHSNSMCPESVYCLPNWPKIPTELFCKFLSKAIDRLAAALH